jgi:hypothetical protein
MDEDRSGNRWISYVTSAPVSFPSPPHHVSLHLRSAPRVRREEVVNGMRNGSRMLAACPVCLSSLSSYRSPHSLGSHVPLVHSPRGADGVT